jgi:hypothetical protein
LPPCGQHRGSRVVKNGTYGSGHNRRQMFRCLPDVDGAHNFAGTVPRLVAEGHSCDHCENPVAAHQGPRVAHRYDFPVAQAAAALVMVGQGVSYTESSDRMRARSQRDRFECGAQLVANWIEVLGPVVGADNAETAWPETVVLDSTWFMVVNRRTGVKTKAFSVLGVHGYPVGQKRGRCWALKATPTRRAHEWERLLRSLSGEPKLVICDGDISVMSAVRAVWLIAIIKRCEHHLRERVMRAMALHAMTSRAGICQVADTIELKGLCKLLSRRLVDPGDVGDLRGQRRPMAKSQRVGVKSVVEGRLTLGSHFVVRAVVDRGRRVQGDARMAVHVVVVREEVHAERSRVLE